MLSILKRIAPKKGDLRNNLEECLHCGRCQQVCKFHAIEVDTEAGKWEICQNACFRCGQCIKVCPANCLAFVMPEEAEEE